MEELLSRHRKELKVLDGEKRAYIKKAKTTKGKKAKDEVASYVVVVVVFRSVFSVLSLIILYT